MINAKPLASVLLVLLLTLPAPASPSAAAISASTGAGAAILAGPQGILESASPDGWRESPAGGYAWRIRAARGGPHALRLEIEARDASGRVMSLRDLPGQAVFVSREGRVVTVEGGEGMVAPSVVHVFEIDGTERWSRVVAALTDPVLSSDGTALVYRTHTCVERLDLADAAVIELPRFLRFAAGTDGRTAGITREGELCLYEGARLHRSLPSPFAAARRLTFANSGDGPLLVMDGRSLSAVTWTDGASRTLWTVPEGGELRDLVIDEGGIHVGVRYLGDAHARGERWTLRLDGSVVDRRAGAARELPRYPAPEQDKGRSGAGDREHTPIPWPLAPNSQHEVGNTYGEFQSYGGSPYPHPGVDVMGADNQPVYAVTGGQVKAILTTSGDLHWRVAIADSATAGTSSGYLYAHLVQGSIAVTLGQMVTAGQYLGDLVPWPVSDFTHIHFARIEDSGAVWLGSWLCIDNPHPDFPNQTEAEAPVFEPARGNDLLAFCQNETSSYLEPSALSGAVDIIAHVGDRILGDWVCTVQEIRYTIVRVATPGTPIIDDRLAVRFDMALDVYQGGPVSPFLVDLLYKQDSVCPTAGNYNEREFFPIITNSNGDEVYEEADRWEAWDTSLLPDTDYLIRVTAVDAAGNAAVDSMVVTTANGNPAAIATGGPHAAAPSVERVKPNPSAGWSSLAVTLAAPERLELRVFDSTGRLVCLAHDGELAAGRHALVWEGTDWRGRPAPSGIYFMRLTGARTSDVRRIVLAR
jgi:murein DD-endopeptidase MepM/ murein hydrolase activator NlpD